MDNISRGHQFKKRFGQNFFKSKKWPAKLAEIAGISGEDTVLEIGPGEGAVTEILLQRAKKVISLEIDPELIDKLQTRFSAYQNFTLLNRDILHTDINDLQMGNYKVVGSLPYNIAKKIIRIFLLQNPAPDSMTVVVQKEVAEDYVALPPKASFLSNLAGTYANVTLKGTIPVDDFYPKPKVNGAILHFDDITPKFSQNEKINDANVNISYCEKFLKFIKSGFKSPRKTLVNNLQSIFHEKSKIVSLLLDKNLSPTARASELTISDWDFLYRHV